MEKINNEMKKYIREKTTKVDKIKGRELNSGTCIFNVQLRMSNS